MLRIGHKGADAIVPGNTPESFAAAVEAGADVIELDLLRPRGDFEAADDWRRAAAGPARSSGPLLVAHDWADAARRDPLTLSQVLDAFCRPPLEQVRFDLDLKIAGREDEVVAALDQRDLLGRAMVSTMELASLAYLREAAPALDRGWTLPKARRDWASSRLAAAGRTSPERRRCAPGCRRIVRARRDRSSASGPSGSITRSITAPPGRGGARGRDLGRSPGPSTSPTAIAAPRHARHRRHLLQRPPPARGPLNQRA